MRVKLAEMSRNYYYGVRKGIAGENETFRRVNAWKCEIDCQIVAEYFMDTAAGLIAYSAIKAF